MLLDTREPVVRTQYEAIERLRAFFAEVDASYVDLDTFGICGTHACVAGWGVVMMDGGPVMSSAGREGTQDNKRLKRFYDWVGAQEIEMDGGQRWNKLFTFHGLSPYDEELGDDPYLIRSKDLGLHRLDRWLSEHRPA